MLAIIYSSRLTSTIHASSTYTFQPKRNGQVEQPHPESGNFPGNHALLVNLHRVGKMKRMPVSFHCENDVICC